VNIASLSLLLPGLLLSSMARAPLDQASDVRARIEQILAVWRTDSGKSDVHGDRLAEQLAALGRPAGECLCALLAERKEGLPLGPVAKALGRLKFRKAAGPIGALLSVEDVPTRRAAVESLAALGGRDALSYVVRAVDDPALEVWRAAVEGLVAQDPSEHRELVALIEGGLRQAVEQGPLAQVLGRIGGEQAHAVLIDLLDAWEDRSKLAALQGLWILADSADGPRVLEELRSSLSNSVRKQCCLFLGHVGHAEAARDLIDCLYDEDPGVVADAVWALRKISGQGLRPDAALWEQWYERAARGEMRPADRTAR
jgi:HEAT repeat protein